MIDDTTESNDPLEIYDELVMAGETPEAAAFAAQYPEHPDLLERIHALEALRGDLDAVAGHLGDDNTAAGARMGPYSLGEVLGRGGMGVVYVAEDSRNGRLVALKVLRFKTETSVERLRREATIAAALHHPGIARVLDVGVEGDQSFLVSEFVDGVTLRALLDEAAAGHAPPKDGPGLPRGVYGRAAIALQVAETLAFAHAHHVVHRDVKPSNIMLCKDGSTKLIDFGIALQRGARRDQRLTRTGIFIGSHNYAAPEQLLGVKEAVGPWTDVYGLGATLFELLCGRPPFLCATAVARQAVADKAPPEKPRKLNGEIPAAMEAILMKAVAPKKEKRYPDGESLAQALRQVIAARSS